MRPTRAFQPVGLPRAGGLAAMLTERHSRANFNSEILLGFGEFALARRPYFSSKIMMRGVPLTTSIEWTSPRGTNRTSL